MRKRLLFFNTIIFIIILFLVMTPKTFAANLFGYTLNNGKKFITYDGNLVGVEELAKILSNEDSSFRGNKYNKFVEDFINYPDFIGKYLSVAAEGSPVKWKAGACLQHDKGNIASSNYLLSGTVTIKWDTDVNKLVTESKYKNPGSDALNTKTSNNYGAELSYALHLNDEYGESNKSDTIFKDLIAYYLLDRNKI